MQSQTFLVADPDEMHQLGTLLGGQLQAGDLVILSGEMGAGKTTLTRGIGEGMRIRGQVTSPTFVLARTHPSQVGGPQLIHLDAYRLGSAEELEDLDLDFLNSVVVAEWGELFLKPENYIEIKIRVVTDLSALDFSELDLVEKREVEISQHGLRKAGALDFERE